MKFIKKPVQIEAVQWRGDNINEVREFTKEKERIDRRVLYNPETRDLVIHTLEGDMKASIGDWIIRGIKNEYYPCKPDIFEKTYQGGEMGSISDGYHTFNELYDHRVQLFIKVCKFYHFINRLAPRVRLDKPITLQSTKISQDNPKPSQMVINNIPIWRSKLHSDGKGYDGWFIMGIGEEKGEQITYHLPLSKWNETYFAETLEKAPEWDGHSSADVLERLKNL